MDRLLQQGQKPSGRARWERLLVVVAVATCLAGIVLAGPWRWIGVPALACLMFLALWRIQRTEEELARIRRDYRQLLDFPAQATWLADPDGKLFAIGERWTEWTGVRLNDDASNWIDTIHPDDRERIAGSWAEAVRTGTAHDQDHRVRMQDGHYRWMRARAFPQRDEQGTILRWVGQVEDIHERKVAEEQLRQTATLLEMIGTSTESIIYAKDREGRMLYANRALEQLSKIPIADMLGRTDVEWNPNKEEAEAFSAADCRVLESGHGQDLEEVFTTPDGRTRSFRSLKSPLRDRSGNVIGLVGVSTDITDQREAEQRERLLTRELDHRAKNLLAVVQSVVTLTRASSIGEFKEAVEGRIQALGRAHSMLAASRWEGADLGRIVAEELSPYDNGRPGRIRLDGPPLILRPAAAQSLALVIHELATNAVKYGCLAHEQGQLDVGWTVGETPSGASSLQLHWTERGGPPVPPRSAASRNGFGTRLIHSSIERQLGGSLSLDWMAEGLAARFEVPLERMPASPEPAPKPGVAEAA